MNRRKIENDRLPRLRFFKENQKTIGGQHSNITTSAPTNFANMASNYSCNDNQNYFVKDGRTTSRVLAPPGGQTSICLGTYQEPPKKSEEPVVATTASSAAITDDDTTSATNATASTTKMTESAADDDDTNDNAPVPKNPKKFQPKNIRVLAPPGGHTSIKLW